MLVDVVRQHSIRGFNFIFTMGFRMDKSISTYQVAGNILEVCRWRKSQIRSIRGGNGNVSKWRVHKRWTINCLKRRLTRTHSSSQSIRTRSHQWKDNPSKCSRSLPAWHNLNQTPLLTHKRYPMCTVHLLLIRRKMRFPTMICSLSHQCWDKLIIHSSNYALPSDMMSFKKPKQQVGKSIKKRKTCSTRPCRLLSRKVRDEGILVDTKEYFASQVLCYCMKPQRDY